MTWLTAVAFAMLVGFFVVGLRRDPSAIPSPLIGKRTRSLASLGDLPEATRQQR
jgi:hypothetical protein